MSWHLLWNGPARVYFNAYDEKPLVWSVDDGDIAHEIKCAGVMLNIIGSHTYYRTEDMPIQPKAWIGIKQSVCVMQDTETKKVRISYL